MTTKQELDWNTCHPDEQAGWRRLVVEDGTVVSEAALPEGMSVREALADYAAGYDAGAAGVPIPVGWELWEGGTQQDRGRWSFTSVG